MIGLACGPHVGTAIGLSMAFGMFTDLAFQCDEAVRGNRTEFDVLRWVKAGFGAPLNVVHLPEYLGLDPINSVVDAVVTVFLSKQLSILYGFADVATSPNPSPKTTSAVGAGASNTSSNYTHHQYSYGGGGGGGGRGHAVLMCQ